jgi:DNA-binding NarL/FixJ family response regulator
VRIVIAEDSALFREGLVRLLTEGGHEVAAAVADADALVDAVREHDPDLAVIDVRMPPTLTDDGARAAALLRAERPRFPMMLLSQHVETRHSLPLVTSGGFGYLLKDRVLGVDDFLDAVRRVGDGGSALDPDVVAALLAPVRRDDELEALSAREREVLARIAAGDSNKLIARAFDLSLHTVKRHVAHILDKLDLESRGQAAAWYRSHFATDSGSATR